MLDCTYIFSLSTCTLLAHFTFPEFCLKHVRIANKIKLTFLSLIFQALWSCNSILFSPREFYSGGSLTGPTLRFCAPVLSADRMSCPASSFFETIPDRSSLPWPLPLFLSSELGSSSFCPGLIRNLPWLARGFTYLFLYPPLKWINRASRD